EYADEISAAFRAAWQSLNISNDDLLRTTSARHEAGVRAFVQELYDRGEIYKGRYEGMYCVSCEKFMTEDELVEGKCPNHQREPVWYAEENYFFRLSKYCDILTRAIEDPGDLNHFEVEPPARRNEVLGKLRVGLSDISISRANLPWGIPLPFDPSQTTYVWVDALLSYITGIGSEKRTEQFKRYWPADVQLMAKDILWFHAIIWPAMLIGAGLPVPRRVYAHGYFTINGQKMSKTLGNVIRPQQLIDRFGVDGARYLVLSAFPFGTDGDISIDNFVEAYNADLANDLGNLLNRTASMINRYFQGSVPAPEGKPNELDADLQATAAATFPVMEQAIDALAYSDALAAAWQLVGRANKYVEENAPWALARSDRARLATVLYNLAESLRLIAYAIYPVMPQTAAAIAAQLGFEFQTKGAWEQMVAWGGYPAGATVTGKPQPLFPRLQ
ncbi:MAG: methionine--tRNA ligase, partial [Bacteroidetes bacterium]|nr:methionine--tRNA ligase [Bacteroidota bacterium]